MPIDLLPGDKVGQYPGDTVSYRVWSTEAAVLSAWLPPSAVMPTVTVDDDVLTVKGGHSGAAYRIGTDGVFCVLVVGPNPLVVSGTMEKAQPRVDFVTAGQPPAWGEVVILRHGQSARRTVERLSVPVSSHTSARR